MCCSWQTKQLYTYITNVQYKFTWYAYNHMLKYVWFTPSPPSKTIKLGVTWPSSRFAAAAGKAFTLTANNTLLAGLEGPLVKDDPSVRRLMEAPGPGITGANNTKGVEGGGFTFYTKKNDMEMALFLKKNVVPLMWQVFLNNKSKGKVQFLEEENTASPRRWTKKSPKTPKSVFTSTFKSSSYEQWKKPSLFRLYRGVYYQVI